MIDGKRHQIKFWVFFLATVWVNSSAHTQSPPITPPCPHGCTCKWTPKPAGKTYLFYVDVVCDNLKEVPQDLPPLTLYLTLKAGSNTITHVPENFFTRFNQLRVLLMEGHSISSKFLLPASLFHLDLSSNKLNGTTIHGMFTNCKLKNLQTLDLQDNPINGPLLSGTFKGMKKLKNLELSSCGITEIETGTFAALKTLSYLELSYNKLQKLTKGMLKGIKGDPDRRLLLRMFSNSIEYFEDGIFLEVANMRSLEMTGNKLVKFPDLSGIDNIQTLFLSDNNISDISNMKKLHDVTITEFSLSNNNISRIDSDAFSGVRIIMMLDLSYNKISHLPDHFLANSSQLSELMLHQNLIHSINSKTFGSLKNLMGLYISNNHLDSMADGVFSNMTLENLFLNGNNFKTISGRPFKGMLKNRRKTWPTKIYLFSNNISEIQENALYDLDNTSTVVVDCMDLRRLPHTKEYPKSPNIVCAPATLEKIKDQRMEIAKALGRSGFECYRKAANDYDCKLCGVGTRGIRVEEKEGASKCINCPAGGYYQNEMGKTACKRCPTGTFVHPNHAPATTPTRCLACPQGSQSNKFAGYRACPCLRNFSRTDRFGPCSQCSNKALACEKDYSILAPGYFWNWNWGPNGTRDREEYKHFIENLEIRTEEILADYGKKYEYGRNGIFTGNLPRAHKCPRESCQGGLDSNCSEGYMGPLCAICRPYYFQRFNKCLKCPARWLAALQIAGVVVLFFLILAALLWGDRKRAEGGRTWADIIISCLKIIVGFYQVMVGLFSSFSNVEWPSAVVRIGKYLKFIELNLVEVAPLGCLYDKFTMNALHEFVIAISVNVFVIIAILVYLFIRICCIRCSNSLAEAEITSGVRNVKKSCYRSIFLFLFATYPITSAKIIQILPANCQELCFDTAGQHCSHYLRTDYSVKCHTDTHFWYWHIAAGFLVYPIGFPLLILLLVWVVYFLPYKRNQGNQQMEMCDLPDCRGGAFVFNGGIHTPQEPPIKFALSLFYENYDPHCWYWEVVEMARKVLLTSVLLLIGPHSRTQIGIGAIVSALFTVLYVSLKPIKNEFENKLQTIALTAIFLNLAVGVMLKISDDDVFPNVNIQADNIGVSVILISINSMIILIVSVTCIRMLLRKLVRRCNASLRPNCSPVHMLHCCLGFCFSVLVPCSLVAEPLRDMTFDDEHRGMLLEADENMREA